MEGTTYKIGEFAKLMGVSTDALRYFEDRGIIEPQRNPMNGYRYYSVEASPLLTRFRLLRACGFSYEQTTEPSCSIGTEGFVPLLDAHLENIDRRIARLKCERAVLNSYKELSERILKEPNFVSVETIDRTFHFYLQFCDDRAVNDKAREPIVRALTEALPLSFFAFLPYRDAEFLPCDSASDLYGVMIDRELIPMTEEPSLLEQPDRVITFHRVCRFVCEIEENDLWVERLKQVRTWLPTQGYEATEEPIVARILPECLSKASSCMEFFVPLRTVSPAE